MLLKGVINKKKCFGSVRGIINTGFDYDGYSIATIGKNSGAYGYGGRMAEEVIITSLDVFKNKLNEGWDPSQSNLGNEPWNEADSFFESHEDIIIYLEEVFKKHNIDLPDDTWEVIMNNPKSEEFESDMETLFGKLYESEYIGGFDKDNDQEEYTENYYAIVTPLKSTSDYKKATWRQQTKLINKALCKVLCDKYYEEFAKIYKKYIGDYTISEAIGTWMPKITEYLTKNPGSTYYDVLKGFGTVDRTSMAASIYNNLSKGVKAGVLTRTKEGSSFKYYITDDNKSSITKTVKPAKLKKLQDYLSTRSEMFSDEGIKLTKDNIRDFLILTKKSPYKYWIKSSEGYSYYVYKEQLYANDSTSGIFKSSKITINNLKDNLTYKVQEETLYDYEKKQDPTVKRPKNKSIWFSILTKFEEIYYTDSDIESTSLVSDQVKATEHVWQFDRYSTYASPLSWSDAEAKFKKSLTPEELKKIEKISYSRDEYADLENHDQERYHKQIIVKLKK